MPGGYPTECGLANCSDQGASTATSLGTVVTTGAINTKGSYVQLVASTPSDACAIEVAFANSNGFVSDYASLDIAIGASGSEVIIIADLKFSSDQFGTNNFFFPISIPAGTRIAARSQATAASQPSIAMVHLFDGEYSPESRADVDTIGFNAATTLGITITPSGTANTKGSYSQITASTSQDYRGFALVFDGQGLTTPAAPYLIDFAIGAAASEVNIIPNYLVWQGRTPSLYAPINTNYYPIQIPAGTRLSARCQTNVTSGNAIGVTFHGVA
jgi:hypothetical protein